ncbi:putative transcriptional regulatory protein C15D4.02 [Fusarium oxysporum f. sp. albedinis]|nr:putative transcriptional regulatory protein C15D4.02 [Fusarium oxysporum f. sp. albedinis]
MQSGHGQKEKLSKYRNKLAIEANAHGYDLSPCLAVAAAPPEALLSEYTIHMVYGTCGDNCHLRKYRPSG